MMHFVHSLQTYSPKNRACRELIEFIKPFEYILIKDECALDALCCSIETKIKEINSAHPKLRPIRYAWNASLKRIDASILSGGSPDMVFILDICRVRSIFQYSEPVSALTKDIAMPGVCRICGCTEDNPCFHPDHGTCWWADDEQTICSHCADSDIANDSVTEHCINSKGGPHES